MTIEIVELFHSHCWFNISFWLLGSHA